MTITYDEPTIQYNSSMYTYNGAAIGIIITAGLSDTVGLTDSLSAFSSYTFNISIIDQVNSSDIVRLIKQLERTVADNAGITDSLTREMCIGTSIADSEGITDTLTANIRINIFIQDVEGIVDNLEVFMPVIGKKIVQILESREIRPQMEPFTITVKLNKPSTGKPQITLQG